MLDYFAADLSTHAEAINGHTDSTIPVQQ
jgi:hypothetical protein